MINFNQLDEFKALLLSKFDSPAMVKIRECKIELNPRMRSTAGRAFYRSNKIQLNERLLTDNPQDIEQTFAHELAHLISYALYGDAGKGHGSNWRRVMKQLGYEPDRTHDLDVSAYARRHPVKAYAKCKCSVYPLKARRINKILLGSKYRCLKCSTHLELVTDKG